MVHVGISQDQGYHFGGPNNDEDYRIWWSTLRFPILGNYHVCKYLHWALQSINVTYTQLFGSLGFVLCPG